MKNWDKYEIKSLKDWKLKYWNMPVMRLFEGLHSWHCLSIPVLICYIIIMQLPYLPSNPHSLSWLLEIAQVSFLKIEKQIGFVFLHCHHQKAVHMPFISRTVYIIYI